MAPGGPDPISVPFPENLRPPPIAISASTLTSPVRLQGGLTRFLFRTQKINSLPKVSVLSVHMHELNRGHPIVTCMGGLCPRSVAAPISSR